MPSIPPRAITFSLTNILKFISLMSPLLISFFMIMYSIITNNIVKGLLFMMGLVIISFLNYLLKNTLKSSQDPLASPFCNMLPAPFTLRSEGYIFNSPSMSSTIIGYTAAYLIFPMSINNQINPALLMFLIALLGINGSIELSDRCTNITGVVLGGIVGILFGIVYYSMLKMSGNERLAYFTQEISDNIQCSKPTDKQFKCKAYRDGSRTKSSTGASAGSGTDLQDIEYYGISNESVKCEISTNTFNKQNTVVPKCGDVIVGPWGYDAATNTKTIGEVKQQCNHAYNSGDRKDVKCSDYNTKPKCKSIRNLIETAQHGNISTHHLNSRDDATLDDIYVMCGDTTNGYGNRIYKWNTVSGFDTANNVDLCNEKVDNLDLHCDKKSGLGKVDLNVLSDGFIPVINK